MSTIKKHWLLLLCTLALASFNASAQEFVLSSPPLDTREVSEATFQPLASLLSSALGVEVRYEYSSNWPSYLRNMQQSRYDLLFDSPHFVSWRLQKIEHRPVVKLSGDLTFVIYRQNTSSDIATLSDLKGRRVCANPIPALDALTALDQFADPWNQPTIVARQGPRAIHQGLRSNACQAAILNGEQYTSFAKGNGSTLLYESPPLSNLALSASPRLSADQKRSVQRAMFDSSMTEFNKSLRKVLGQTVQWEPADEDAYRGYAYLLDEFWGF